MLENVLLVRLMAGWLIDVKIKGSGWSYGFF
jgi:hypothetical protein